MSSDQRLQELTAAYALLQLSPDDNKETVQRRRRILAMTFHPDKAGEAGTAAMAEINRAADLILQYLAQREIREQGAGSLEEEEPSLIDALSFAEAIGIVGLEVCLYALQAGLVRLEKPIPVAIRYFLRKFMTVWKVLMPGIAQAFRVFKAPISVLVEIAQAVFICPATTNPDSQHVPGAYSSDSC